MEEIEKDDVATEAALPPSPPGSTEEAFAGTESKNSKGMTNEKQEESAEKKTAQYGSIPDGPNTGEQNKTKAENDSSTPKSWWRSVFSFCILTPDEASLNDQDRKKSMMGNSADGSKLNSCPTNGEIKTRVNRLSPQSSSAAIKGKNSPLDDVDDDATRDASSAAGICSLSSLQQLHISSFQLPIVIMYFNSTKFKTD